MLWTREGTCVGGDDEGWMVGSGSGIGLGLGWNVMELSFRVQPGCQIYT